MSDLLIRNLSADTHEELKRRAGVAGTSLQAYVTQLLERSTQQPALDAWLRQLDDLPRHPDITGAAAVRASRSERA